VRESSEESALQCQPAQTPQISGVIVNQYGILISYLDK
jgi:hypothetical protein